MSIESMPNTYLICTGKSQAIEDWDEDMSWDKKAQKIGATKEPVFSPKAIDFSGDTKNGHSWLESGK